MDSTIVRAHQHAAGGPQKGGPGRRTRRPCHRPLPRRTRHQTHLAADARCRPWRSSSPPDRQAMHRLHRCHGPPYGRTPGCLPIFGWRKSPSPRLSSALRAESGLEPPQRYICRRTLVRRRPGRGPRRPRRPSPSAPRVRARCFPLRSARSVWPSWRSCSGGSCPRSVSTVFATSNRTSPPLPTRFPPDPMSAPRMPDAQTLALEAIAPASMGIARVGRDGSGCREGQPSPRRGPSSGLAPVVQGPAYPEGPRYSTRCRRALCDGRGRVVGSSRWSRGGRRRLRRRARSPCTWCLLRTDRVGKLVGARGMCPAVPRARHRIDGPSWRSVTGAGHCDRRTALWSGRLMSRRPFLKLIRYEPGPGLER